MTPPDPPLLTLDETIADLTRWADGGRMDPVAVAISAIDWMRQSPLPGAEFRETRIALLAWLETTERYLPDETARAALHWLLEARHHYRHQNAETPARR